MNAQPNRQASRPVPMHGRQQPNRQAPRQANRSNLRKVFERSFTGSSVTLLTLMEDLEPPTNIYKDRFLIMLTFAPGQKSEMSPTGRSFDFSKRIIFKCSPEKLKALAYAVRQYVAGRAAQVGEFSISADPKKSAHCNGGAFKTLKLEMGRGKPQIVFLVNEGEKKAQAYLEFPNADAFAWVCDFVAAKALELEYLRQRQDFIQRDIRQTDPESC